MMIRWKENLIDSQRTISEKLETCLIEGYKFIKLLEGRQRQRHKLRIQMPKNTKEAEETDNKVLSTLRREAAKYEDSEAILKIHLTVYLYSAFDLNLDLDRESWY